VIERELVEWVIRRYTPVMTWARKKQIAKLNAARAQKRRKAEAAKQVTEVVSGGLPSLGKRR
jgi:hypothetical protein